MLRRALSTFATVLVLITFAPASQAAYITSHDVTADPVNQLYNFTIVYDSPPDFVSVDAFGRQADTFGYFLFYGLDPHVTPVLGNLHLNLHNGFANLGDGLSIRDIDSAGHYGSVRDNLPFTLTGNTVTFSAPFAILDDLDGKLSYQLETYVYGGITGTTLYGNSVPEPSSLALLGLGISFIGCRCLKRT